jgi:hydroxypyruvate reductase/glycerate 2-kinase
VTARAVSTGADAVRILNAPELTGREPAELRDHALGVAAAGLKACDVGRATERTVTRTDAGVRIGEREFALGDNSRLIVVGSGKATLAIAAALERVLGERVDAGAVVVRHGEDALALERIEVLVADHPLPSERSIAGALRLTELAQSAQAGDLVLASFTGGSSALASLPPDGVSGDDKRHLHQLLLSSGAPITEINTVRKHVSAIKGGRLALLAEPATLVNLTASDVAGDVLDAITDPTVQDTSTSADAVDVLERRGLWGEIPASVRAHLESPASESPLLGFEPVTELLVDGRGACAAMADEASARGLNSHLVSTALEGEAVAVGRELAALALGCLRGDGPVSTPCVLVGCGGESTVSLGHDGAFGNGGPNQEAALAVALSLPEGTPVCICLLDTDGSDGGTDAAGALVDGGTATRATAGAIDIAAALAAHRSGDALEALGDRVITGPTHTNVNDLFVIAVGSQELR